MAQTPAAAAALSPPLKAFDASHSAAQLKSVDGKGSAEGRPSRRSSPKTAPKSRTRPVISARIAEMVGLDLDTYDSPAVGSPLRTRRHGRLPSALASGSKSGGHAAAWRAAPAAAWRREGGEELHDGIRRPSAAPCGSLGSSPTSEDDEEDQEEEEEEEEEEEDVDEEEDEEDSEEQAVEEARASAALEAMLAMPSELAQSEHAVEERSRRYVRRW